MSTIEKLMISGIRCFHPDESQIIEIYSPLTIIAGSNGSGKTVFSQLF